MQAIGDWLLSVFGPHGWWGIVLFVFLIFLIDAIFFPTLPEVFFIIGFMYDRTLEFGLALLAAVVVAEIVGVTALYLFAENVRIPNRIKGAVEKYCNFLIVSDERMLLVNRFAPMLPFAGVFISVMPDWRLPRALFYVVVGCVLKYGLLMLTGLYFFTAFPADEAQKYTLLAVIAVLAASGAVAYLKKKEVDEAENC
ncbi:MAG: hypothetical protein GX224_00560 [Thermoplasmatales archaeon]|nr:hypothetical protein [Thermoplasmatales archaeon]